MTQRWMTLKSSFTIVELLVVCAIVSLLAAVLLPSLKSAKDRGNLARCINNLRQIGIAIEYYKEDNDQYYPIREPNPYDFGDKFVYMNLLGSNYLQKNWAVFKCPLNKNTWGMDKRTNSLGGQMDYEMNSGVWSMPAMGSNQFTGKIMYLPANCVVIFDFPGPNVFGYSASPNSAHPDGDVNAYYADGHVGRIALDQGNVPVDGGAPDFYEWGLRVF